MISGIQIAFIVSVIVHSLCLFIPITQSSFTKINSMVIKSDSSVEVSLVETINPIKVKSEEKAFAKEMQPKKVLQEKKKKEETPKKKAIKSKLKKVLLPETNRVLGAITKEIKSLLINKPPIYPHRARMRGWEGEVIVIADVSHNGLVKKVSVFSSSGYSTLDDAAVNAVSKWRFRDIKTGIRIKVPISFVLVSK